jgi:hypothetical protein
MNIVEARIRRPSHPLGARFPLRLRKFLTFVETVSVQSVASFDGALNFATRGRNEHEAPVTVGVIAFAKPEFWSVRSAGGERLWDIHTGSKKLQRYYIILLHPIFSAKP